MTGFLWSDDADAFFGEQKPNVQPIKKKKMAASSRPGQSSESPLSVSQLNAWIKRTIDEKITTFWLVGEIGNLIQSSAGHVYLTIKDSANQISAVLWRSTLERLGMELVEGMAVICQGRIDVYGPRGTYQVVIQRMEQQGVGALQLAFRKLYAKLEAEGLFRPERKKPLPRFPTRIGFVTSPAGAAIRDFIEVLRRRWPGASVLVIPARVQGDGAAREIAAGIRVASVVRPALDVLIVGRGGGSLEDLWCFNEEIVVRALAACPIPTVSAVGHEIDITLSDLAADVRALTPSEAAERVVPSRDEILDTLSAIQRRIDTLLLNQLSHGELRLQSIISRPVIENPERLLDLPTQRLDELHRSLNETMDRSLLERVTAFEKLTMTIEALSPLKTLSRGYSVTLDATAGHVIASVDGLTNNQLIRTRLADGEFTSQVVEVLNREANMAAKNPRSNGSTEG